MSKINCSRKECKFNEDSLCTTDIELSEGGCSTYKETEISKRSKFHYTQMEMSDVGSFIFIIKHNVFISLNAMLDVIFQEQGISNQKIIVDMGYSHGLSFDNRFFYFEITPNDTFACGYDLCDRTKEITGKTKIFLSVKSRDFFYNNQHLIENSIWCKEEQKMMKMRGTELLDYVQGKKK